MHYALRFFQHYKSAVIRPDFVQKLTGGLVRD
ncbi:hypothetical protein ACVIRM_000202 [Rhizobium laguerreae]